MFKKDNTRIQLRMEQQAKEEARREGVAKKLYERQLNCHHKFSNMFGRNLGISQPSYYVFCTKCALRVTV